MKRLNSTEKLYEKLKSYSIFNEIIYEDNEEPKDQSQNNSGGFNKLLNLINGNITHSPRKGRFIRYLGQLQKLKIKKEKKIAKLKQAQMENKIA